MPNIHTYMIGPFTPYYDAKQLAEPAVVGGKNFMPTTSGYKSAFGSDVLSDRVIAEEHLLNGQVFSLDEKALIICNRYGIMQYDEETEGWYYLTRVNLPLTTEYPWAVAYVGGYWFFCKLGFGVWRYSLEERSGRFVTDNVPSEPVSICASGGRLVILGKSTYAWSAIGDGTDLLTSLVTGAGFQALSLIGGTPLAVKSNTIGYMVYTTNGIIRVESIDAPNPYQHKVLTTSDYAPVSAWAVAEIGTGSHVVLTKSGLYATSGDYPQILEKEFSKWLTGTTLKYLLQSRYTLPLALSYDATRRWLIISYAEYSITAAPYSLAYVLDIELAKWGKFVRNHYFIGSAYVPKPVYRGNRTVTASRDGAIRIINKDFGWTEVADQKYKTNFGVAVYPSYHDEVPDWKQDGSPFISVTVFTSGIQLETYNWNVLGRNAKILGAFKIVPVNQSVEPTMTKPWDFKSSYEDLVAGSDVYIDMEASSLAAIDMANIAEPYHIDMGNIDGDDIRVHVFTSYANCDARYYIYREVKVDGELGDIESQLDIGLWHVPDFDDLQSSTVMTGFALMHDQTVGDTEYIDMQEMPDIVIDMETALTADKKDDYIDMGVDFLDSPNYSAKLISSSDGYGHRDLHKQMIEPYSVVGDRFNYNSYSTGLYHGFTLTTERGGGYYHLKQVQVNIIQGGLIYDGAQTVRRSY